MMNHDQVDSSESGCGITTIENVFRLTEHGGATALSRSRSTSTTELRFELPDSELSVIDAVANSTNTYRSAVVRKILSEWTEKKLHEATLVCRVTGVNPMAPEPSRSKST